MVDEHSFEVNAKECSRRGGNCDILDRTKTGKGTLSEDRLTLTLTFTGDPVQSNCPNPADDGLWTYTSELKLQRQ